MANQPVLEADHVLPSNVEVGYRMTGISTPPYVFTVFYLPKFIQFRRVRKPGYKKRNCQFRRNKPISVACFHLFRQTHSRSKKLHNISICFRDILTESALELHIISWRMCECETKSLPLRKPAVPQPAVFSHYFVFRSSFCVRAADIVNVSVNIRYFIRSLAQTETLC
jgi:hypothetical protein